MKLRVRFNIPEFKLNYHCFETNGKMTYGVNILGQIIALDKV